MLYKIGEVARILGISTDLIRYYEEKGAVKPKKDRLNRYRYYDLHDVNLLIDCLWYKKMGFGIEEIGRMSNAESRDDLSCRLDERSNEISANIQYQKMLLTRMLELNDSIACAKDGLGVCDIRLSREFLYYINRKNGKFEDSPRLRVLNKEWGGYMPFTKRMFFIEEDSLAGENDDYLWGYSIGMQYASYFSAEAMPPVEKMPENLCVHSAFVNHGSDGFTARLIDFMKEFAKNNELGLKGFAFWNLVCGTMEEGLLKGYFETWMPVERA